GAYTVVHANFAMSSVKFGWLYHTVYHYSFLHSCYLKSLRGDKYRIWGYCCDNNRSIIKIIKVANLNLVDSWSVFYRNSISGHTTHGTGFIYSPSASISIARCGFASLSLIAYRTGTGTIFLTNCSIGTYDCLTFICLTRSYS